MRAWLIVPLLALALGTLAACGGEEAVEGPSETAPPVWENKAPTLYVVSPGAIMVGQGVQILGKDFITPDRGYSLAVIKGTYFDEAGGTQLVDLQVKPKHKNHGELNWKLWPNIVFDQTGDKVTRQLGFGNALLPDHLDIGQNHPEPERHSDDQPDRIADETLDRVP